MKYKFRNELLEKNEEFKTIFTNLIKTGKINEFDDKIKSIILRDRTAIVIGKEPLAFKDLFHQGITGGKCKLCAFELVLLLDKLGIYSEAVYTNNKYFINTEGSYDGGHWYVEAYFDKEPLLIDTSLMITGNADAFKKLGHKIIRKCDIDTLFKENSELIDYYENMIIHK